MTGQIQVGAVHVDLPAVETYSGVVVRLQVHGGNVSHLAIEPARRIEPTVDFNPKLFSFFFLLRFFIGKKI